MPRRAEKQATANQSIKSLVVLECAITLPKATLFSTLRYFGIIILSPLIFFLFLLRDGHYGQFDHFILATGVIVSLV